MTLVSFDPASTTGWAVAHPPYCQAPTPLEYGATGHTPADYLHGHITINNRGDLSEFLMAYEIWFRRFLEDLSVIAIFSERFFSGRQRSATTLCISLGAGLRMLAYRQGIYFREYAPQEIKKHATGNGRAGKPAMFDAARDVGWKPASYDEADALWLMDLGISQLPDHLKGIGYDIAAPPAIDGRAEKACQRVME